MTRLSLNGYQTEALETAVYPAEADYLGLHYVTLGLVGEAGELANEVKKITRDDDGVVTEERRRKLVSELGDVLWYAALLADELRVSLEDVASQNLEKLAFRQANGTLKGSGEVRNPVQESMDRRGG